MVQGTEAKVNKDFQMSEDVKEHEHKEADTLMPLHFIDCLCDTTLKELLSIRKIQMSYRLTQLQTEEQEHLLQ